jgi:hypothetical protein
VQDRPLNVMLDPSLLLDAAAFGRAREQRSVLESEADVFVPAGFAALLRGSPGGNIDNETYSRFVRFYVGGEREWTPAEELARELALEEGENGFARPFAPDGDEVSRHVAFYDALREELEMAGETIPFLAEAIFEEWVFLQERSWGISHTTAAFGWMARAGGVVVQAGKRGLDRITKRTLNKEAQYELTTIDRLTALGKWVVFAGATGTAATIGAAAGAGMGAVVLGSVVGSMIGQAVFMIDP